MSSIPREALNTSASNGPGNHLLGIGNVRWRDPERSRFQQCARVLDVYLDVGAFIGFLLDRWHVP